MAPTPVQILFITLAAALVTLAKADPITFEAVALAYGIAAAHPPR